MFGYITYTPAHIHADPVLLPLKFLSHLFVLYLSKLSKFSQNKNSDWGLEQQSRHVGSQLMHLF